MNKKVIVVISICVLFLGIVGLKVYKDSTKHSFAGGMWVNDSESFNELWSEATTSGLGVPLIVSFTADWCVVCAEFNPILERVANDVGEGKLVVRFIDVDKYRGLLNHFPQLQGVPTQVFVMADGSAYEPSRTLGVGGFIGYSKDNGEEGSLTMHTGAFTESDLLKVLKEMGVE